MHHHHPSHETAPVVPALRRRAFLRTWAALPMLSLLAAACGRAADDAPAGPPPTAPAPPQPAAARSAPTQPAATAPAPAAPTRSAPAATPARAQALPPTPACGDGDDGATPPQTAGPYFTPNSPERASLLEPGITGTKLVLAGSVLSTDCRPVARALVDFWQADGNGQYDNTGYRLRGHQFTDAQGRYTLETIVPGQYPGRTRHIHVLVQAPNRPVLVTQLYFPNEAANRTDGIFRPELVVEMQDTPDGRAAAFNFVLDVS